MRISATNSFLRPLKRGPWRPRQMLYRKYMPWVAIAMSGAPSFMLFWIAYSNFGTFPWEAGLIPEMSITGTATFPSRGGITAGLAWMFFVIPALFVVFEIFQTYLASKDKALTGAGFVCGMLAILMVSGWAYNDSLGRLTSVAHSMSAQYETYKLSREILVLKGQSEEAKILDAKFVGSFTKDRTD